MPAISGKTRVVAVIGDPVSHSRSPAMHNAAFEALGLDYVYVAMRVAPKDLRRAIAGARALGIWGLNVTVPHKEKIIPLLDRLTPRAREIGAVNTVFRRGDELVGDNTDAEGVRIALRELGVRARGKKILLLGAGGAARAVAWTLSREAAREITLANRTRRRATALARTIERFGSTRARVRDWEEIADPSMVTEIDLVLNCTSIGLDGRSLPPIALESMRRDAALMDLVYSKAGRSTPLVTACARRRITAADGQTMLVGQALAAFRSWTGKMAPRSVMIAAL